MPDDPRVPMKLIPVDELAEIVTEAGLVHHRALYETSLSHLIAADGDPLADLATAYELAASLGIPEEKLTAVLRTRYPSAEDQLAALETHRAIATTHAVAHTYEIELLSVLRQALPSRRFDGEFEKSGRVFDQPYLKTKWRRDYTVKLLVKKESHVRKRVDPSWWERLLRRPPREEIEERQDDVQLATIQVGNELLSHRESARPRGPMEALHRGSRLHLVVTVGSGVFIKLCNQRLMELRNRFERHNGIAGYEVLYDYVVQEVDQLG